MDRKTEEAISLAQKGGCSDVIPLWCKAPEDISPPENVPSPSPSEAAHLETLKALLFKASAPKRGKKNKTKKKKAHPEQSLGSQHANGGPRTVAAEAGVVVGTPREKQTLTPPPEQSLQSPLACNTNYDRVPWTVPQSVMKEEDPTSEEWLFSLTDHLDAIGPSKFKLPEGWADLNDQEFGLVITDALAVVGIETSDLPEGWTTVVQRKKRKKTVPTLPNVLCLIVGDMAKQPQYQEPEDEREWEIDVYWHAYNLSADDTFDVLEKLPPIPCYPIFPEMVPQDAPNDVQSHTVEDHDDAWTCEIYRCISNLTSQSTTDLNQHKETGLPDLAGLPDLSLNHSKEMGLPDLDLAGLPDLPDHVDDLEECFKNLLTDTPCGNDELLVSGGIPNLGIEMNSIDIPELDLANVPGAVPPCGVGAKKKEAKKITK